MVSTRTQPRRLLIVLVALCVLSSMAGSVAYFFSVYALVRQQTRLHALATDELMRDGVVAALNERLRVVRFLAEVPLLAKYFQTPQESTLYQIDGFLDEYAESDSGPVGYLLDADGVAVASSSRFAPDSVIGKRYGDAPYFQKSIKGAPTVFLSSGTSTDRPGIYISHPVTGSGGIFGVVVIRYPFTILEASWAEVPGIMAVVNPEGQIFAANRPEWVSKSLPHAVADHRQGKGAAADSGQGDEWQMVMPDGSRYGVVAFPIAGIHGLAGWRLVYLRATDAIAREVLYGLLTPVGFALIALLLLVVVGSGVLYHLANQELRRRAAAEKKVGQARMVLEEIFNITGDSIRIIDQNFTVVEANRTFAELVGRPLGEIKGKKCYEVFPGQYCGTSDCPKTRVMDHGEARVRQDVVKKNPAGQEIACLLTAMPFRDAEGRVVGILESVRDITERVASEQALEQAFAEAHKLAEEVAASRDVVQRQKAELEEAYHQLQESQAQLLQREKMASIGQLAAGVAHEINNPMGFISSNLGTMAKYTDRLSEFIAVQGQAVESCCGNTSAAATELADQRKRLKIDYILNDVGNLIKESLDGAERVRKIVQGLKSFSRLDQAEVQAADINECLESTINIVWNELKYKAEVKKEYGELPKTVCNPQQLNQVFMNLLVNAAQAIEKHGTITVKTWADPTWVYVSVSDTGSGIPKDKISRIFEPFFTTKEVGKGTGLGLSIAYDIVVKKHKGTIEVQSEEGKGSTFTLRVPLVDQGNSPS